MHQILTFFEVINSGKEGKKEGGRKEERRVERE
jgi:hypothetical protein